MRVKKLAALTFVGCVTAWAHHSFAAEFDQNDKVDLAGTIVKVEWMNPHAHFSLAVKGADGKVTVWDLETGSPNALARRGVTRNALKEGDTVRVTGYRAKDHSHLASAGTVTFSDGRSAFAGTSGDGSPDK
jgi:WD40 repeat protein